MLVVLKRVSVLVIVVSLMAAGMTAFAKSVSADNAESASVNYPVKVYDYGDDLSDVSVGDEIHGLNFEDVPMSDIKPSSVDCGFVFSKVLYLSLNVFGSLFAGFSIPAVLS